MPIDVLVNDLQRDVVVDTTMLLRLASFVLDAEGYDEGELSIALLSDKEMQGLNRSFRRIDEPTDVLSFCLEEYPLMAEIIVAPNSVQTQAHEHERTFEEELVRVTVHGILHVLGYDHERDDERAKMSEREGELVEAFFHNQRNR